MDGIWVHVFSTRVFPGLFDIPYSSQRTQANIVNLASIPEVRAITREFANRSWRGDAYSRPVSEKPKDAVPILVFVHCTVCVYVAIDSTRDRS